jgi:hypothetical protein
MFNMVKLVHDEIQEAKSCGNDSAGIEALVDEKLFRFLRQLGLSSKEASGVCDRVITESRERGLFDA